MKRKFLFGAAFLLIAWAATSCKSLTDCQFCKLVERTSSGAIVSSGSETEYCGADLIAIKAIPPASVGSNTAKYECR